MTIFNARHGFTLLEILVVVAIIAVLASTAYLGFDDSRKNAADKAMMAEFKEVQVALELYRAQNDTKTYPLPNGTPPCGTPIPIGGERFSTDTGVCAGVYIQDLVPDVIAELPNAIESANPNCSIEYRTDVSGSWYKLTAIDCVAGGEQITIDNELARCPSDCANCSGATMNAAYQTSSAFTKSFAVYSQNGQCE